MTIIYWIVLGLIVGALAKLIMPGKDPGGFIVTTLLGIGGAVVGGFVSRLLGYGAVSLGEFNLYSILFALGGAIILLALYRMVKGKKA